MFFTGDIALPYSIVKLSDRMLFNGVYVGNLEGSLIDDDSNIKEGVYNNCEAVKYICSRIPFKAFGIANNHLCDCGTVTTTLNSSQIIGVPVFGAGRNIIEAQKTLLVSDDDGTIYRLIAFGWPNIQCKASTENIEGVNPYNKENVVACVKRALQHKEPVICFMHWDYELEKYPLPYDRQLAMDLIDLGVSAIIGCHAHRVQPIEFYRGRPIVYGLGNFMFHQGAFFNGELRFPKYCEEEYVFELAEKGQRFFVHHYHYDSLNNVLGFVKTEELHPNMDFDGKAEFTGLDAAKYETWFRKNRVQKKLLPVFYAQESRLSYSIKSLWIKIRGRLINFLTLLNLKSTNREKRQ